MTRDEFWNLIAESKAQTGQNVDAQYDYLAEKLTAMRSEEALRFHGICYAYTDAAVKYGLWDAASCMLGGCSDDMFMDFRCWLVAQGKEVFMQALANPDSLASVELYGQGNFETLAYLGSTVYEQLTGKNAYDDFPWYEEDALRRAVASEIHYDPGISYPRDMENWPKYIPNLCAKYLTRGELEHPQSTWNTTLPEVREMLQKGREYDLEHAGGSMTLKLYSPLTAEIETEPEWDDYYDEPDMMELHGDDLVYYEDVILQGITDETMPEEQQRGLMLYFSGTESIDRKVESVKITAEARDGKLYGVAVCDLKQPLTAVELSELKEYITGQYSDGWGEGFEQRPRACAEGDLYVHFWQSEGFYIRTESEMAQRTRQQQRHQKGGGAR